MVINASPKQPPKVVDVATAVEAGTEVVERLFRSDKPVAVSGPSIPAPIQISRAVPAQNSEAVVSTAAPAVPATPKVGWLKSVGLAIGKAAKEVVAFLSSTKVQAAEAQVANIAELLLPVDAPIIQTFQVVMGKIFQQAVVTETAVGTVAAAGSQKLAAVVASIGPELDQWVASNFPGSATISADVKAGLVNAIVALQNDLTAPPAASSAS
jgi:hypothetical protein